MIGSLILAAGNSSRLGEPKQLLRHRGETLIRRAVRVALEAGCSPVVVVCGAAREGVEAELGGLAAAVCYHAGWQRGMGSSVRAGMAHTLSLAPKLEALMLMVCDQPFVTAEVLRELIAARERSGKRAAACGYADTVGVPALFDSTLFPLLAAVPDTHGARRVLSALADEVARVPFPRGEIDIDTPADRLAHLPETM